MNQIKISSLYWSVYKNLENELISLSNVIHIDDNQLDVYSIKIATLLVNTCVEIEALSKELYFIAGGAIPQNDNELYFDTGCLGLLNDVWLLSQKKIQITSTNFFLQDKDNKEFAPLHKAHKRGSSGASWAKAYQAVKHNRVKSLKEGTLKQLIRALGALFLLNVYYLDKSFNLGKNSTGFDARLGSDVFSVKVASCTGFSIETDSSFSKYDSECPYLLKFTEDVRPDMETVLRDFMNEQNTTVYARTKKFLEDALNNGTNMTEVEITQKIDDIQRTTINEINQKYLRRLQQAFGNAKYEAVINKSQFATI